ncbi:hypothetical protein [Pseudomonas sp. zjy_11]|uniref:hypothetical protein n=1 Tax=Pseudomonas sp. zjy_11 TaxID=3367262 RepID=UPI003709DEA2
MIPSVGVLGVLGWCWVGSGKSTQFQTPESVMLRECVLGVLGLRARARARFFSIVGIDGESNLYASPKKPNTPNTLNTDVSNPLNLLGLKCVGFVLALPNACWVVIGEGW